MLFKFPVPIKAHSSMYVAQGGFQQLTSKDVDQIMFYMARATLDNPMIKVGTDILAITLEGRVSRR